MVLRFVSGANRSLALNWNPSCYEPLFLYQEYCRSGSRSRCLRKFCCRSNCVCSLEMIESTREVETGDATVEPTRASVAVRVCLPFSFFGVVRFNEVCDSSTSRSVAPQLVVMRWGQHFAALVDRGRKFCIFVSVVVLHRLLLQLFPFLVDFWQAGLNSMTCIASSLCGIRPSSCTISYKSQAAMQMDTTCFLPWHAAGIRRLFMACALASFLTMAAASQPSATSRHTALDPFAFIAVLTSELPSPQSTPFWSLDSHEAQSCTSSFLIPNGKSWLHLSHPASSIRNPCFISLHKDSSALHLYHETVGPSSKGNLECGNTSARSFAAGELLVDEAVGKSTTVYTEERVVVTRRKSNSFVKVAAEKVGPAVVRLDTERDAPIGAELVQSHNKLFRNLFGDEDSQTTRVNSRRERGQGSGLVFDGKMGTIVTNAHVIKGADYVKVITGIYGQLVFDGKLGSEEAFNHKQFCCKLAKVNFFHTSLYSQL